MKKSVAKKIKFRKNKGVVRMPMAKGHNRTRKTSKLLRKKRKKLGLANVNMKLLKQYLHAK